jgi:hypothetical protein
MEWNEEKKKKWGGGRRIEAKWNESYRAFCFYFPSKMQNQFSRTFSVGGVGMASEDPISISTIPSLTLSPLQNHILPISNKESGAEKRKEIKS